MGLPLKSRLRKKSDFDRVSKNGSSVSNKLMLLVFTKGESIESRTGFAINKRVGGAVTRNRIRRKIKEYMRPLNTINPYDMIFIVRRACASANSDEIRYGVKDVLEKAQILK